MCDGVEQKEGTTVAGGDTWRLGVAVELMETTKSRVHGGSMLGRIQGGREYSLRWSLLRMCRILFIRAGLRLDLCCIVDRIRVVVESDSCSLGLPYNAGGATQCNL